MLHSVRGSLVIEEAALEPCETDGAVCGLCFHSDNDVLTFDLKVMAQDDVHLDVASKIAGVNKLVALTMCDGLNSTGTVDRIGSAISTWQSPSPVYSLSHFYSVGYEAKENPSENSDTYLGGMGFCHPESDSSSNDDDGLSQCGFLGPKYTDDPADAIHGVHGVMVVEGGSSELQGIPLVRVQFRSPSDMSCIPGICSSCTIVLLATCGPQKDLEVVTSGEFLALCNDALGHPLQNRCEKCYKIASPDVCNYQSCASDTSCSGHGQCDVSTGNCVCNSTAWVGQWCDQDRLCMDTGGCDEHATCKWVDDVATCSCRKGYVGDGQTCEISLGAKKKIDVNEDPSFPTFLVIGIAAVALTVLLGVFFGRHYCVDSNAKHRRMRVGQSQGAVASVELGQISQEHEEEERDGCEDEDDSDHNIGDSTPLRVA